MRATILLILLCFIAFEVFSGAGTFPQGDHVKMLKDKLEAKNSLQQVIMGDSDDPTAVAKDAAAGSLYLRTDGTSYVKQDAGSSVNWLTGLNSTDKFTSWVTGYDYKIGDISHESNGIYLALTDHTSGTFVTDLANLDWQELSTFREANFNISPPATTCAEGKLYWNSVDKTLNICTDQAGVSLQTGQEGHKRIYNNTGSTITNGQIVYINGFDGGSSLSTVALARSDLGLTSTTTLGVATHDIATAGAGIITTWGTVRDLDTSLYAAGQLLYLSSTVSGGLTATAPDSPDFTVRIGTVGEVNALTGSLDVHISPGDNRQGIIGVFNGAILESHVVTVASDGATVTATLANTLGGNLSLFLDKVFYDFTAPANVTLTSGSDSSPTLNYVYIPNSTKTLTASTSGWPSEQHVPVGTFFIQSAGSVLADAPYKEHAWTDHMVGGDDQGHISHLNKWIRNQHATWLSGSAPTFAGSGTGSITFSTTSGTVLQLHEHSIQAFGSPAEVRVVNDSVTPYVSMTDLVNATLDSTGVALQGRTFALVIWGSVNETTGSSKLFMNLPSGAYSSSSPDLVRTDASKYTDYSIPDEFKGTGFLIHRLVIGINPPGTVWTIYAGDGDDIRGQFPNTVAGSSSTVATEFPDNAFAVFNVTDNTKEVVLDVSGVTTANTRTMTIPDASGTLALLDSGVDQVFTNDVKSSNKNGDTLAYADADNVLLTSWGDALTTSIFSEETVNHLSGTKSYEIAVVTAEAGWVQSPSVVIEKRSQGNLIASKFKYTYDGDNGDMKAYLYDVTNSQTLGELYLDAASTVKGAVVYGNAADTTALIQLRIEAAVVNNGKLLVFDDVEFTDDPLVTAAINSVTEFYRAGDFGGYSTNNTYIPYFTDERVNTVSKHGTITNTSADGWFFTASGKVTVDVTAFASFTAGDSYHGFSLNPTDAEKDGNIVSVAAEKNIVTVINRDASEGNMVTAHIEMVAGDELYFHTQADAFNASTYLHGITFKVTASNDYLLVSENREQAHFVGSASWSTNAGHTWSASGAAWSSFPSTTTNTPTVKGKVVVPDSQLPVISLTGLKKGFYNINYRGGLIYSGEASTSLRISCSNGETAALATNNAGDEAYSTLSGVIEILTDGDYTFEIQAWNGVIIYNTGDPRGGFAIEVNYLPPEDEKTVITTVALPQSEKNSYAARIANNGTASVTSVDADFIESVNRTGVGLVDVVFKTGVFSVTPAISGSVNNGTAKTFTVTVPTTSGFSYQTYDRGTGIQDLDVSIKVTKQGADASSGQVYVGTVPRYQIMYASEQQSSGVFSTGGATTFTATTWTTRYLNAVDGDTFGSIASNQLTLPEGEYMIRASSPAFVVSSHVIKLRNITDSVDTALGIPAFSNTTNSTQSRSWLFKKFSISGTKVFEIQHQCATTRVGGDGFGKPSALGTETYTSLEIIKLR